MRRSKTLRVLVLADPGAQLGLRQSDSAGGPWAPVAIPPGSDAEARHRAAQAAEQLRAGELTPELAAWAADALAALGRGDTVERALGIARRRGRPGADTTRRDVILALAVVHAGPPLRDGAQGPGAFGRVAETFGESENVVEAAYHAWTSGALRLIDLRGAKSG